MRLKKIPSGKRVIRFINEFDKHARIFLNKKPFLCIPEESVMTISHDSFYVGIPLKEFPEMQLYSNLKLKIEYI